MKQILNSKPVFLCKTKEFLQVVHLPYWLNYQAVGTNAVILTDYFLGLSLISQNLIWMCDGVKP